MSSLATPTSPARGAEVRSDRLAIAAAIMCGVVAAFEVALAAGVPWGHAAWGGAEAVLSPAKRVASGVAAIVWAGAAALVMGRARVSSPARLARFYYRGAWVLAGLCAIGAAMNLASRSRWESVIWGPFTLLLATLVTLVARRQPRP